MAQTTINNGDSGLNVRTALNSMFSELYSGIDVPLKIKNVIANTTQAIPANSFILSIFSIAVAGTTPTVRIGTTPNGTEIMGDTVLNNQPTEVALQEYFSADTTFYITIGGGTASFRINILYNFY